MRGSHLRFVNATLLALIVVLTLTGTYALFFNTHPWVMDLHRGASWALLAFLPFKAIIAIRSLRRGLDRRFKRSVVVLASLLLAGVTLIVIGLGVLWLWHLGPELLWLWQTTIAWHWMLALVLLLPFAFHVWQRWPRPRRADFTARRNALKLMGLSAAGVAGWLAAEAVAQQRAGSASTRRFTGSREQGSFSGNAFPVTNSLGEGEQQVEAATWRLTVDGAVRSPLRFDYDALLTLPAVETIATLDCTSGWYSTQVWRGVPLAQLLEQAGLAATALGVKLQGVSGYWGVYTLEEAQSILLATHVGGEVLNHWHGFPLRAVVPSRRGWFWIKWLTRVEVL